MADKKAASKTVPESVVIGLRKELRDTRRKLADSETELKNARLDLNDEESVGAVRKYLLEEARELEDKRSQHSEDSTALNERERSVVAKELALDLKGKGLEVTSETLLEVDDMKSKANDLYAEFLAEKAKPPEKEKGDKEQTSLESKEEPAEETEEETKEKVYESETPTLVKKEPKDMDEKEFDEYWDTQRREAALSKK